MKKVFKSKIVPKKLQQFTQAFPHESWERFRRHSRRGYKEVKAQIFKDQKGLCAYCEINIKFAEREDDVDDFRVEHFCPKGETVDGGKNWHLQWDNMLGVCHGGSQKYVTDADWRYSARKNDRSCDIPKGGRNLARTILNPLKIPANIRLFRYGEQDGRMLVDHETCPPHLARKARNTINELNLNARRLRRMRAMVVQALREEIEMYLRQGMPLEECLELLAKTFLAPDDKGRCQAFFSVIRWYLGPAAEDFLAKSGYEI